MTSEREQNEDLFRPLGPGVARPLDSKPRRSRFYISDIVISIFRPCLHCTTPSNSDNSNSTTPNGEHWFPRQVGGLVILDYLETSVVTLCEMYSCTLGKNTSAAPATVPGKCPTNPSGHNYLPLFSRVLRVCEKCLCQGHQCTRFRRLLGVALLSLRDGGTFDALLCLHDSFWSADDFYLSFRDIASFSIRCAMFEIYYMLFNILLISGIQGGITSISSRLPISVKSVEHLGNVHSTTTFVKRDLGFQGQIGNTIILTYGDTMFSDSDYSDTFRGMTSDSMALATHDPTKVVDLELDDNGYPQQFCPLLGEFDEDPAECAMGITNVVETFPGQGETLSDTSSLQKLNVSRYPLFSQESPSQWY